MGFPGRSVVKSLPAKAGDAGLTLGSGRSPGEEKGYPLTMNKASGGDGIPVELFQILKVDAVKVLHSICQKIWKTQQ